MAVFLLATTLVTQATQAEPGTGSGLIVTITQASTTKVCPGEPFVLHYKIANTDSVGQATFYTGANFNRWYTLSLRSAYGITREASALPAEKKLEGLHPSPEVSILAGESIQGDIVATRRFPVLTPGKYVLTLHMALTSYTEPKGAWYPEGRPNTLPQQEVADEYTFPLLVTANNPARLQRIARSRETALLDVNNAAHFGRLAEELFSLPEASAKPSWQTLIADRNTSPGVLDKAVDMLETLQTTTAADLLLQMHSRAIRVGSRTPHVENALASMYNTGSPALREHIKNLARLQGIELGDKLLGLNNPN